MFSGAQPDEDTVELKLVAEELLRYATKDKFRLVAESEPKHVAFFAQAEQVSVKDAAIDGVGLVAEAF